jgi:hypothetical protein
MPGTGVIEGWVLAAAPVLFGLWWDTGEKERLLVKILNQNLGKYFKNLDADTVGAGLLEGKIDIPDLQLKTTALDDFRCVST